MFAGLRHDRIVGCDDEEAEVEPGRSGEHVRNEPFGPGTSTIASRQDRDRARQIRGQS